MVKFMITEGLLFELTVLIAISSLLLRTLYRVNIENLPLTVEEVHILYEDKIVTLENAVFLHVKEFSKKYAIKAIQKIRLSMLLARLRSLSRRRRDYVVIGRICEKIYHMVSERK